MPLQDVSCSGIPLVVPGAGYSPPPEEVAAEALWLLRGR